MARHDKINVGEVLERIKKNGANSFVTIGEAASLVASRTMDGRDALSTARSRAAMRLIRAAKGGDQEYGGLRLTDHGCLTVDEFAHWATLRYPGFFDDIPKHDREARLSLRSGMAFQGRMSALALPGSLEECHVIIQKLTRDLQQCQKDAEDTERKRKRDLVARFARRR